MHRRVGYRPPAKVSSTAFRAVVILFDEHLWQGLVSFGVNSPNRGLLYVDDGPALATFLNVPENVFCSDPQTFTDTDGAPPLTAPAGLRGGWGGP